MPQTHFDHRGRNRGRWAAKAAPLALAAVSAAAPAFGQDAEVAELRRQFAAIQARLETLEAEAAEREATADEEAAAAFETDRDGVILRFGGRINQALLYASQGDQDQVFIADNDASGSRLEFLGTTELGEWTTGAEIVISAEINSTDNLDFGETLDASLDEVEFRQAHWFFEHPAYGYISIGQGDTAAEDTMHVDLSGTDLAGAGSDVDDIAGGLTFAANDGTELTELDDFFDALDGSRALRVLYRSPQFAGFEIAASLQNNEESLDAEDDPEGDGVSPAVALRYGNEFGGYELEAAVAWHGKQTEAEGNSFDANYFTGSVSVLAPFGVNVTFAAAKGEIDGFDDPVAYFAKLGYIVDIFDWGETRFSIDAYYGENAPDFADADGDLPGATSYGAFAVQEVADLSAELYVGARLYELDGVFVDDDEAEVDDLFAVISGARVRF